ncbi:MAG: GntR family transcriptional regulator [Clostridium sp.]
MILKIDFDSEEAIYTQIINEIIKGIAKGELNEGDELPSVRGLANDIGVNMHTVNKCYGILKDKGYIRMDRRRGAVISFSLENSNNRYVQELDRDIEIQIAECINRGIAKDKIIEKINRVYDQYNNRRKV